MRKTQIQQFYNELGKTPLFTTVSREIADGMFDGWDNLKFQANDDQMLFAEKLFRLSKQIKTISFKVGDVRAVYPMILSIGSENNKNVIEIAVGTIETEDCEMIEKKTLSVNKQFPNLSTVRETYNIYKERRIEDDYEYKFNVVNEQGIPYKLKGKEVNKLIEQILQVSYKGTVGKVYLRYGGAIFDQETIEHYQKLKRLSNLQNISELENSCKEQAEAIQKINEILKNLQK